MRKTWALVASIVFLLALISPARAGSTTDECEGDSALDLSALTGRLKATESGRMWRIVIETCEAFTPADLRGPDGGEHLAMSLHFDTVRPQMGRFERTLDIYNCMVSADQVCATMTAGHSSDRYYFGPRDVGEAEAAQISPTAVEVIFPNRWLGKKARDRSGFIWSARTADEVEPGVISFDYAPDGKGIAEHP